MLRLTLDANVYIPAALFGGKPEKVLDLAREKKIKIVISEPIIKEIGEVLKKKFGTENWRIQKIINHIRKLAMLVVPNAPLKIIAKHEQDNRILECAVEGSVDCIVTGDKKHILPLREFRGIKILSPKAFLEIFRQRI